MIKTFNYWEIVGPATMILAALLAIFSVTEDGLKAKSRGPEKLWKWLMVAYGYCTWLALMAMLFLESFRGIIEFWGREAEGALIATACTILGAPAIWGWLAFELFMFVRKHRFAHVEHRCKYGLSKEDRIRRRRADQKKRSRAKATKARRKEQRRKRIRLVPISTAEPVDQTTRTTSTVKSTQRTVNFRLEQRIREYRIEERTDLNATFMDPEGVHPISELLPEGVRKYYVAINTRREGESVTFLSWEHPEANLRRFVSEMLAIEDAEEESREEAVIG